MWQHIAGGFLPGLDPVIPMGLDVPMFRMDPDIVMAGLEIAYCC